MPFLDWVNKNQAKETTREVLVRILEQANALHPVQAAV